jgi:hypothetical protein
MKILTATATSQGTRKNDFDHAIEGELVGIGLICATDQKDPDGGCGCGRAFFGLSSHRATTTAKVRDLPMTRDDVIKAFAAYYEAGGYGAPPTSILNEEFDGMQELMSGWPAGAVIERRLDNFQVRMIRC